MGGHRVLDEEVGGANGHDSDFGNPDFQILSPRRTKSILKFELIYGRPFQFEGVVRLFLTVEMIKCRKRPNVGIKVILK